ncbi:MAG: hypothetical protein JWN90_685 [Parcubacteria group bacterium]|nr:hypothetical protein [Parcubacteria group bacterium]
MPMIELRYQSQRISDEEASVIAANLEGSLRLAINGIRKNAGQYKITVEGDRFGPIIHNQPDLRIYIFYHEEWRFSPKDLDCLTAGMGQYIQSVFFDLKFHDVSVVVRFYSRTGHASVKIG